MFGLNAPNVKNIEVPRLFDKLTDFNFKCLYTNEIRNTCPPSISTGITIAKEWMDNGLKNDISYN